MPEKSNNPFQFWEELKRRRVIRVITVYAAAAFVLLELVDIISEPFGLPDWTLKLVTVLLVIGFIISVILSWVYDVTPEGIQKTKSTKEAVNIEKQPASTGWKIATFVSVLIIIAFVIFYIVGNNKKSFDISKLEKSIAVLPFDNMSVGEEYVHMGDAITDEIILELQKIKEFDRVLSRTSTIQYKDNKPAIPEIAENLDVNYIIEGSIQRHKEDVSIRVQVIRAKQEDHVWADEFNGKWEDIFSIQDEIAFQVAKELKTVLSNKEVEKINEQPTVNSEAYNLYLKGRFFWNRRTEIDLKKSIEYFEQAIEMDTSYALAYAGLADSYFIMSWWGWYPKAEGYTKGKEIAQKALSIDNNIAEAHATLGGITTWHDWNWKNAEIELKKAISINPYYASAHQWYAELLDVLGKNKEARDQIDIALKLSPNTYQSNAMSAILFYHSSDFTKSIEASQKTLEIQYYLNIMRRIFKCYVNMDMEQDAINQLKRIISKETPNISPESIDKIHQQSGIEGIVRWYIDWELLNRPGSYYYTAALFAMIKDSEKAIEYLEEAFIAKEPRLLRMNNNPDFDILRNDPRFIAMLKQMNLK